MINSINFKVSMLVNNGYVVIRGWSDNLILYVYVQSYIINIIVNSLFMLKMYYTHFLFVGIFYSIYYIIKLKSFE